MCMPSLCGVAYVSYFISSLKQISRQIILSSLFVDGKLSLKSEIYIIQVRSDPTLKPNIYPSGVCFLLKLYFLAAHCTPSFSTHCGKYPCQTMKYSLIFAKLRDVYFSLCISSHHSLIFSIVTPVAFKHSCLLKSPRGFVKTQIDNPYSKNF